MKIRRPAVAGLFYPADPQDLRETVDDLLAGASLDGPNAGAALAKAVIAPHAGYAYSGPIAATIYQWVAASRDRRTSIGEPPVARVVLIGPAHRVGFRGLAVSGARGFESPLGVAPVDRDSVNQISILPGVQVRDDPHEAEHSLEVHIPFLKRLFSEFRLVPIVVGDASSADVADVLRAVWGGPETLVVVSSDLSHYLEYDAARRTDRETARAIEALRFDEIRPHQACGALPVNGLLRVARERNLRARSLDLRNSGDTAGSRDRVVGYGAFGFSEP